MTETILRYFFMSNIVVFKLRGGSRVWRLQRWKRKTIKRKKVGGEKRQKGGGDKRQPLSTENVSLVAH